MPTPSRRPVIVCASSLPSGREAFATLGEVRVLPEGDIDAAAVRDADLLFTRSKVKVNDALLEGAHRLSFYGTATAGYDHVDTAALERRGIAWSQAPGSNANSVAEYVLASLARLGRDHDIDWTGRTLGIVGAGHVGSRLAALAAPFGLTVLLNDPPLRDRTGDPAYRPIAEVLAASDIVSLHVPLSDDGPYPTRGMIDRAWFAMLKPGAVFINASRGEVVDEAAFAEARHAERLSFAVLDVFDHEPDIGLDTLALADIATPHIAGYSYDGRVKGTDMVYRAACRHLGVKPAWHPVVDEDPRILRLEPGAGIGGLYRAILEAYDPRADDRRLRTGPEGVSTGRHFQQLRASYPRRMEFNHYRVEVAGCGAAWRERFAALGFIVTPDAG